MRSDPEYFRLWRVQTGRTTSIAIPVTVLRKALAESDELRRHLGPAMREAIDTAVKTGATR